MERFARPDPATSPAPIDTYLSAVIEIAVASSVVVVQPRTRAISPLPGSHLNATTVHLITAANPWSQELTDAQNEARNAEAEKALNEAGIVHLPALGRDEMHSWNEPGFALVNANHEVVMGFADAWSQHGIYRWDDNGWWLVLTNQTDPIKYSVEVARF